jgi:hypothetical protein
VLQAIVTALRPYGDDARFFAAFEGGSAATGRLDAYSDIDLCVVADAALNDALFAALEEALQAIGAFSHVWNVADAPWPGFAQKFYFLDGSPPSSRSTVRSSFRRPGACSSRWSGTAQRRCCSIRSSWIAPQHMDRAAHEARRQRRLAQNRAAWPVYRMLVDKELARGRPLDALASTRRCCAC